MGGNQQLNVVFTGLKAQNRKRLFFEIIEHTTKWNFKITTFYFVGNTIYFPMPAFPYPSKNDILTSVLVYYEGEAIDESPFVYSAPLDGIYILFSSSSNSQLIISI